MVYYGKQVVVHIHGAFRESLHYRVVLLSVLSYG